MGHILKNHEELPTLVGALTHETQKFLANEQFTSFPFYIFVNSK